MRKVLLVIFSISLSFLSCSDDEEYNCESGNPKIVGAQCNDGTRSNATGQGACSSHGGVQHWICQD